MTTLTTLHGAKIASHQSQPSPSASCRRSLPHSGNGQPPRRRPKPPTRAALLAVPQDAGELPHPAMGHRLRRVQGEERAAKLNAGMRIR